MKVNIEVVFRKMIAYAAADGSGFNCLIEVSCKLNTEDRKSALQAIFEDTIKLIDHHNLSKDLNGETLVTLPDLCKWVARKLKASGMEELRLVRWVRGDRHSVVINLCP